MELGGRIPTFPSHYPLFQSHPYQTYPPDAGDYFPTWSNENWQTQEPQCHQSQVCPDKHQYQSYPQQDFGLPSDVNQYANSMDEQIEVLTTSQQGARSCLQSNVELASGTQIAHDEHKSSLAEMIKQASLLADIMKGIQEDRTRAKVDERGINGEGMSEPEKKESSNAENKSENRLERQEEVETVEVESAEEETQAEERSITALPDDEASQKI